MTKCLPCGGTGEMTASARKSSVYVVPPENDEFLQAEERNRRPPGEPE